MLHKRRVLILVGFGFLLGVSRPAQAGEFDYSPWHGVLRKFVTETGRVDYAALKAEPADLNSFVAELAARSPVSSPQDFPAREDQLAYWINAYNALAIEGVVERWPVKSVRDIGTLPYSFFWRKKFVVGGRKMTLNGIEDILRKQLREPRIHFAIVCASNSCPRLRREAYTPENVNQQLDAAAREFINQQRNLRIDAVKKEVTVARIFGFYRGDFESYAREKGLSGADEPVLDYILRYANEANRNAILAIHKPSLKQFDYDWGVNDIHSPVSTANLAKEGEKQ